MKLRVAIGRSVEEWVGATPDTDVPERVAVRVFDRLGGRCGICGRLIGAAERKTVEHVRALVNGGENRESNLSITCSWCLPGKNAADVAEKKIIRRKRVKHVLGHKPKGRPLPGSKASGFRKRMNGDVERW